MSIYNKWKINVIFANHQDEWIKEKYETLTVRNLSNGSCIIEGELMDISQVYGLIIQLRDMNANFTKMEIEKTNM